MCAIQWCLVSLGLFFPLASASVTLQIVGGSTSFQEGSKVELICTISPYSNVMTWLLNNDPYGGCVGGFCNHATNKPFTFKFNFDVRSGIFKLTIDPVYTNHSGLAYACDDGASRSEMKITVTMTVKDNPVEDWCEAHYVDCIILTVLSVILLIAIVIIIILYCCVAPKFTMIKLKETEIYLEWTDSLNYCFEKKCRYNTVCIKNSDNSVHQTCSTYKTELKFSNLQPMTVYEISLSRQILCLCKSWATIKSVVTRQSGMEDQEHRETATSIRINWQPLDFIDEDNLVYEIYCNEVKIDTCNRKQTNYTVTDLIPCKTYKIETFAEYSGKRSLFLSEDLTTRPIASIKLPHIQRGNDRTVHPRRQEIRVNNEQIVFHMDEKKT